MIRPACSEDFPTAAAWWSERNRGERMWVESLPKIGCVCEDDAGPVGMAWAYLDNSKGIGFVEHLVMRPGISATTAKRTAAELLSGLEAAAGALGYTHLIAYSLPACISTAESCGYVVSDPRPKVAMIKTLNQCHSQP